MTNQDLGNLDYFRRICQAAGIIEFTPEESRLLQRCSQCINCGLCISACEVVRALARAPAQYCGPRSVAISLSRSVPEFWSASDVIYYCTMCGACEAICPSNVPIPEIVAMIRSKIIRQSTEHVPRAHTALLHNLETVGNIYGQELEPLPAKRENPEFVLFVGCVGSYVERESVLRTISLLSKLGVSFTSIDELCCGGPVHVAGAALPGSLSEHNLQTILSTGTNKVITSCPRCYLTLSRHPSYGGKLEVQHTTDFFAGFDWNVLTDSAVTYHDPCELGRYRGEYDAVRTILRRVAPNFKEMTHSRETSACCGAGGGLRGIDARLSINVGRSRLQEAMTMGAEILVTECYSCLHNFFNARRSKDPIEIYNLSEYLYLLMQDKDSD